MGRRRVIEARDQALSRAEALVRERFEAHEIEAALAFLRDYFRHAAPEDVAERHPIDLYGAALSHRSLAAATPAGELGIRVHNPRADEHGWSSPHTVVQVVIDDQPFVVDTVHMELSRHGLGIHSLFHPIIDGRSHVHVEVDRLADTDPDLADELVGDLRRVLGDAQVAVADWHPMRDAMVEVIAALRADPPPVDVEELAESISFLEWLVEDHFTFLGHRVYDLIEAGGVDDLVAVPGSGLGILRGAVARGSSGFAKLSAKGRELARAPVLLNLTKANARSTVHRPARLDYIGIKRFDASGAVAGEWRFLGLYTSAVYAVDVGSIPVVRRKVSQVLAHADLPPGGHDERDLRGILETYPRDELLQIEVTELAETALGILHLQERRRVRVFVREDRFGRFVSALVFLPRDRYTTERRLAIQAILAEAYEGVEVEHTARVSESVLARLHIVVHLAGTEVPSVDLEALEERIALAVRDWADDLRDALVDLHGEDRGIELYRRYRDAFPPGYQADHQPRTAVADIGRLEALGADDLAVHLYRPLEAPPGVVRAKVYRSGRPLTVSELLPTLEHLGAHVVDQRPHTVRREGEAPVWIYDFGLRWDEHLDLERVAGRFEEAFWRVWAGDAEDDGLNRLVVLAGLGWRDVEVLRAYVRYLRQAGTTFSPDYVVAALCDQHGLAAALVELFRARFDPTPVPGVEAEPAADDPRRAERIAALDARIDLALDAVVSLDQDRILRSLVTLVRATRRTNAWQQGEDGQPLALKLEPGVVSFLPAPRPRFEIFVHSPRVEGIHLRGGPVARGGIRWSDRLEDYRSEVLGLMKAQLVKNAVIVPVGAKGGFVVKRPPGDPGALRAEVAACYRLFIGGLLDLVDNLVDGRVVGPERVVRHDGDDPYLVVAADKGTATFSDLANEIATSRGFWLGDAFASGGSTGYDHKAMGITARGAWISALHHLRQRGIDATTAEITVAGIGDMSGDVFGNGMLLSPYLRLVAAFDHRHVFLDPDPDPAAAHAERRRLFEQAGSTWADYDPAVLSVGGAVAPRTAKSIPLSPEARAVLDVGAEALTPDEVIKAILRAPVDLLFNGGIGTYVKASGESHAEVSDKTNDGVRVDAGEVRARVVVEGGNLGLTQRARVELARSGVAINTDAVDNSAGVDCSDHEVNIKIALDAAVTAGELTGRRRDELLSAMTDEVAHLVLAHNDRQNRALANASAQAASLIDVHGRYLRWLEHRGALDRDLEALPTDEELAERKARGEGLVGPELAVLLAVTKNWIGTEVLAGDLPDDPYLERTLVSYFPAPLVQRCLPQVLGHRLRREITTTVLVGELVDRQGITSAFRLADEVGASHDEVAAAFVVARDVFDLPSLWADIEALDHAIPPVVQTAMFLEGRKLAERACRWLLRHRRLEAGLGPAIDALGPGVAEVARLLDEAVVGTEREAWEAASTKLADHGVPGALATRVAGLEQLLSALDITEVAATAGEPVATVAEAYFLLDDRLSMPWLRAQIVALPRDTRWQTLARISLRDDLYELVRAMTAGVLAGGGAGLAVEERIDLWAEAHRGALERCAEVLGDVRAGGAVDLATLSVLLREARALAE
jgi:glutamate dehydrogenase